MAKCNLNVCALRGGGWGASTSEDAENWDLHKWAWKWAVDREW